MFVAWVRTPLTRPKPTAGGVPLVTITERFKRTEAYFVRLVVPIVAGWVAVLTLVPLGIPKLQQQALAIGGGVLLLAISALLLRHQYRCPRCGTDFNKERIAKFGRRWMDARCPADLWETCPHCGVSFNDPWP
jgi:DNA-directed RNA polymerase subunit RPC12/RpoP